MSDTALRLAHFHHHRQHKGARKHRVGEATPEPTRRPARWGRDRDATGLKHANPVARAMGQVSLCSCLDVLLSRSCTAQSSRRRRRAGWTSNDPATGMVQASHGKSRPRLSLG